MQKDKANGWTGHLIDGKWSLHNTKGAPKALLAFEMEKEALFYDTQILSETLP